MIKELVLTIILGVIFGFGLTGGFITLKKNNKFLSSTNNPPQVQNTPTLSIQNTTTTPMPTQSTEISQQINIDTPENESIVNNSTLTLRGSTNPKSIVVIKTPIKTYTARADENGQFFLDIELETGANLVKISSFDSQDNEARLELLVTYSTSKI